MSEAGIARARVMVAENILWQQNPEANSVHAEHLSGRIFLADVEHEPGMHERFFLFLEPRSVELPRSVAEAEEM